MMELWPFTNFHDLNLDWIIKTIKEWTRRMTEVEHEWSDFVDNTYKNQITEILEEHPEWTTTVMDGAITYNKLHNSLQAFVTPEIFGAVGDGVTDDSAAIAEAFDSGKTVIFVKNYKSKLVYNGDISIIGCKNSSYTGSLTITGNATIENVKFISDDPNTNFNVLVQQGEAYIRNCVFDNAHAVKQSCLTVSESLKVVVSDCEMRNNNGRHGLSLPEVENASITNNFIHHIYGPGIQTLDVCKNVEIIGNNVIETNIGDWQNGGSGSDGCISTYGDTTTIGTTPSENIIITNNIIRTVTRCVSPVCAVRINGVENAVVSNNTIEIMNVPGIIITDRYHSVNNNEYIVKNKNIEISNNSILIHEAASAVRILGGENINIVKNDIINDQQDVNTGFEMITIGVTNVAYTKPVNMILDGNRIRSAGGTKFALYSYVAVDITIKNNDIETGRGIYGLFGKIWIVNNILHTISHGFITSLDGLKIYIQGNVYAREGSLTSSFVINSDPSTVVYNADNTTDADMFL